ncbi:hypothetical protein A7J50_3388 [Pseudomonas antarctica]|uniref:Lipoprotein n=1 Tax=Pseudomonas antarctica TaxID=219572 RepID=A0A172Z3K0_9PSED|nr:hypothetical protein [Pseudomonas antarctica]ANF86766.1 hypothetical protein A7J50_3388 [Pseudomonas antarctica]
MKKSILSILLSAVAVSGCTMRVADVTVVSTKNYNINGGDFVKGKRVVGEDSYPVIIFPLGFPNVKTAMDRAIEKDPCAVGLSDAVVYDVNHSFLFGVVKSRVEGDLIIDRSRSGCKNRV